MMAEFANTELCLGADPYTLCWVLEGLLQWGFATNDEAGTVLVPTYTHRLCAAAYYRR